MNFAVRPTLSQDLTKIVLVACNPAPYASVWATVGCEDIRQEFDVPNASNEVLRQRASIRQTNTDALGEIAKSLFRPGRHAILQGIHLIEITRPNLAAKKEYFAWGYSDLPPILQIPDNNSARVIVEKFEREKSKVETLLRLLSWETSVLLNPNLNGETGLDVVVERGGKRFGFQVTDFHSHEGAIASHKGSELRRHENKKAKDGLPGAMCINPDPIPGLAHRIEDKLTKRWSQKDFPEVYLLVAASIPELPGVVSTFLWDPKMDINRLNSNLFPRLERCGYSAIYLYNIMQSHVYRWAKEAGWEGVAIPKSNSNNCAILHC